MTAHFDRNISFVTSYTQNPLIIDQKSSYFPTFFQLSMTKHLISPKLFLFHPYRNSLSSLDIFVHHCAFCASPCAVDSLTPSDCLHEPSPLFPFCRHIS